MRILKFIIILFLSVSHICSYSFPKQYTLILNEKNEKQVTSKEQTDDSYIVLKNPNQKSTFRSLDKGLNLRAVVDVALNAYYYTDGIAVIIQNHSDGNTYIGDHGESLGVKNSNELCTGLSIKIFQNKEQANLIINFAGEEIFRSQDSFQDFNQQQIFLQIQILENDEASLTFGIGSEKRLTGPLQPLKLLNFRKGLCIKEKEDLSAFVGFSSSQISADCIHKTGIKIFKMVESDCGCPTDNFFPLKLIYKQDLTELRAEDLSVQIEEPKICNLCEDYQGKDRDINVLLDYNWKIKGKKIVSNNKKFIEFQLPLISGYQEISDQHLLTFLIDEISFGQKQFSVLSNTFLQENWLVPVVIADPKNNPGQQSKVPMTGFSNNKTTQPPNIPPLDDKAKQILNEKQENVYQVDVYSRPIIKEKQENSLFELSDERIKIDSIKNISVENSNGIVQVKEWNPTKDIIIQTEKYALQGQIYEYEIKRQDGSILSLVKTHPELALGIVYDGLCYGNYCTNFFCKKNSEDNPQPISELDKVCKERDEDFLGKLGTLTGAIELGPDSKLSLFSSKISKLLNLNELYYIAKVYMVKCSDNDIECKAAKFAIIGKTLINQISLVGKINLFFDLFDILAEANYYVMSKLGKWITSKFTGDPHIRNLDGCQFDFQGQGDFVIIEEKMIGLAVHSRFQQHSSFKHVTTIRSIAVRGFWGAPLVQFESLLNEKDPLIRINGLIVKIESGSTLEIPNLKIKAVNDNYFIEFLNGLQLQITNHGYGFLWTGLTTVPAAYSGKLSGILGNGDSEVNESDFQPGNNIQEGYEIIKSCSQATDEKIWKFGQSWRLTKKEDSILFYKQDEDPNFFYDKNWNPMPKQEVIKQADQEKKQYAQQQCQQLTIEEDFQNCYFDQLLIQTSKKVAILDAYKSSKELPQEGKIYLIKKKVDETSVELEFGINEQLEQTCSKGCSISIYQKKTGEQHTSIFQLPYGKVQQKTIHQMNQLDKHASYSFKVKINNQFQSNLINLYTVKDTCVPYCAKQNACGDDGCGGQCVQKQKCSSECKFGVCLVSKDDKNGSNSNKNDNDDNNNDSDNKSQNSSSNDTLKIVLISLSVIILIVIIIFLVIYYRRKMLIKQQQLSQSSSSNLTTSSIEIGIVN